MTKLSIREAAKHFEVSRPTLLKDLRSGKVSGELLPDIGAWQIETSELARVYQSRGSLENRAMENPKFLSMGLPEGGQELHELKEKLHELDKARVVAEARAEAAERIAEERGKHLEDLRRLLLTPQTQTSGQRKSDISSASITPPISDLSEKPLEGQRIGFWRRLFGK